MQLFCAAACFLFTSFTPLQASELGWSWCNLAPDRKRLFISLDACCLRYCLFPEPWLKSLKFLNSPSAQTARIFTRLSQWFLIGNNQMLNSRHLRSDELFSVGRHLAPLPFRSVIVLVGLGAFVCRVNERGLLGGLSGFRVLMAMDDI